MPLYVLHVTEGEEYIPDLEGIVRHDLAAVQKAAIEGVRDLISDAVRKGGRYYRGRLDVENERGEKVPTLTFVCPIQLT